MDILHQNNEIKDCCNCRNKKYCLLGGKCSMPNMVYRGTENDKRNYANYANDIAQAT